MPEERNECEFSREDELNELKRKLAESKHALNVAEENAWNHRYHQLLIRSNFLIGFAAGMGGIALISKAVLRKMKANHSDELRRRHTYGDD